MQYACRHTARIQVYHRYHIHQACSSAALHVATKPGYDPNLPIDIYRNMRYPNAGACCRFFLSCGRVPGVLTLTLTEREKHQIGVSA